MWRNIFANFVIVLRRMIRRLTGRSTPSLIPEAPMASSGKKSGPTKSKPSLPPLPAKDDDKAKASSEPPKADVASQPEPAAEPADPQPAAPSPPVAAPASTSNAPAPTKAEATSGRFLIVDVYA